MKVDAERPAGRQALDQADVRKRGRGRIDLAIAVRERVAVTLEQGARLDRVVAADKLIAELVEPGADDRLDPAFEAGAIRIGLGPLGPLGAPDDEMHAD